MTLIKLWIGVLSAILLCSPLVSYAAIAYDNAASVDAGTASSASLNITIASGASLWVCVPAANTAVSPDTVKWNGSESLTKIVTDTGFINVTMWYLANPTAGAHSVSVSFTGSHEFDITAISLTGAAASPLGASNNTSGNSTASSLPLTTTAANSWIVDCATINGAQTITTTGTNQANRINLAHVSSSQWMTEGSTLPATSITSYTDSYSWTPSRAFGTVNAEVKAAASPATPVGFGWFTFLGDWFF